MTTIYEVIAEEICTNILNSQSRQESIAVCLQNRFGPLLIDAVTLAGGNDANQEEFWAARRRVLDAHTRGEI